MSFEKIVQVFFFVKYIISCPATKRASTNRPDKMTSPIKAVCKIPILKIDKPHIDLALKSLDDRAIAGMTDLIMP